MELTSRSSEQRIFQEQMSGVREVLVKTSLSQGDEPDYTVSEVDSFLTSLNSSKAKRKKISPNGFCLKMLKDFCQATAGGISLNISLNWPKLGTMSNGRFSIPRIMGSPRTGNECTLSGILEAEVDEKYYLSARKATEILSRL